MNRSLPFKIGPPKQGDTETWERIIRDALVWSTDEEPLVSRRNGAPSKWVLDMRVPLLRGESVRFVGLILMDRLRELGATAVAGYGLGGTLLVSTLLALAPELEGCVVRRNRKLYDRLRLVEGTRPARAVFVDDSINGGSSAKTGIIALQNEGIAVTRALFPISRSWGRGAERLLSIGVSMESIVTLYRHPDKSA